MKKYAPYILICLLEIALVYILALIFRPTSEAHPVAFILGGALMLVSTIAVIIVHTYHKNQLELFKARHILEQKQLQDEVDFALRGIGGGGVITKDNPEKSFVYVSESLAALFGYTVEEFIAASDNRSAGIVHPDDYIVFSAFDDEFNTLRFRVRCKDGSYKWVSSRGKIVVNERGERERYSFNHDITALMQINQELKDTAMTLQQERWLYRDALLHNCDYAYIVNVTENRFHDVYRVDYLGDYGFGSSANYDEVMEVVVANMQPVILSRDTDFHLTSHYIKAYAEGRRVVEVEYYIPATELYKKKTIFLSKDDQNTMYAFVVAHDITQSRREVLKTQAALAELAEAAKKVGTGDLNVTFDRDAPGQVGVLADVLTQTVLHLKWYTNNLREQTTKDPMTGVKNKRAWQAAEERLNTEIASGAAKFAIVVCDINGLKLVNDTIGHKEGDALIIRACRYICGIFSHSPVFRLGGDEFGVILEGEDLTRADALIAEFDAGMTPETRAAASPAEQVSIAMGVSHFQAGDEAFASVFRRADEEMYRKKDEMKRT